VSINVLPRLEGRKTWTPQGLRFEATTHNLDLFKELGFEIVDKRERDEDNGEISYKVPYKPRRKPDKHQVNGLAKSLKKDHFAFFMDVGTGKSYMFIYLMGLRYVNKLITGAIIISPKGVNSQWINEQIPEHLSKAVRWRGIVYRKNKVIERQIMEPCHGMLDILSIHIDAVDTKKGFAIIQEFIRKHKGRVMCGLDEADLIKNYKAGRTVACMEFRDKVRFRVEMTGTPVPAKLQDLWSEFRWLDPNILGIEYVTTFRREYCIMGGYMGRDVIGYRDTERFHNKIKDHIFSVSRTDIGVLPPEYHRWRFDLGPKQRALYDQVKRELDDEMADRGWGFGKIGNKLMTMQQICSGFMTDGDGKIIELGENPRAEQLIELLEAKKPQKALIWARFHYDLDRIKEIVGDAGVEYSGRIDDDTREKNKQAWLSEGGPIYFYGTPGSGGVGLNLQGRCRHGFYYTNSYKARERWQSEGRISRRGQWGPAEFTDLVARNTKDSGILANLRRKKNIQDLALMEMRKVVSGDYYEDYDYER